MEFEVPKAHTFPSVPLFLSLPPTFRSRRERSAVLEDVQLYTYTTVHAQHVFSRSGTETRNVCLALLRSIYFNLT